LKDTLSLGSEEDWTSDGMYESSSINETEKSLGCKLPRQFYGSGARPRFYDLYRLVYRQKMSLDTGQFQDDKDLSPRELFLRSTIDHGIPPVPIIVRNLKRPHTLNLAHQGLGDLVGQSLAMALPGLPILRSLNIRDNRLTDASL
ncbi:unnamed protein product, partial [Choristocarpus tenellus]